MIAKVLEQASVLTETLLQPSAILGAQLFDGLEDGASRHPTGIAVKRR
jgi:hypothetical protein